MRIFITITIALSQLLAGTILKAQTFTDIRAGLTGVAESSSGWINPDRDGDLDVFVAGEFFNNSNRNLQSFIYRNLRNNNFAAVNHNIPAFYRGDFGQADFNLDGINDLFVMGELSDGRRMAKIFNGNTSGGFTPSGQNFEGLRDGAVALADYDGDGDTDILITGEGINGPRTLLYQNERSSGFKLIQTEISAAHRGDVCWIDFNLDGRPDLIITGINEKGQAISLLYHNTTEGFIREEAGFIPLKNSAIACADVDNDGDQDVLIMGEMDNGKLVTRLYRNDRDKGFSPVQTPFVAIRSGFAHWADMEGDGDMDLLISGETTMGAISKVYRNDRRQGFTDIEASLMPLYMSDGEWGDYDLDGDLDILISGMATDYSFLTRIYRNDGVQQTTQAYAQTADEEPAEDIWNNQTIVPERRVPIYYFVYSSTYSDLLESGTKEYFTFISPIKKPKAAYEMEDIFNPLIRQTYPRWGLIDQGNIITNGYHTLEEAQTARRTVIEAYQAKNFQIIEVNW
ncbi:MAG: VCBS repeat-containing protein [Bacteroidales bacterium]|jgi:hypothetical protein|nr:VCBS repeat-containing protein [Bacteroidales bacterium]